MLWKVTHNNCPEVIVEALDAPAARLAGLAKLKVDPATTHPVRVWPANVGETDDSLATKLKAQGGA